MILKSLAWHRISTNNTAEIEFSNRHSTFVSDNVLLVECGVRKGHKKIYGPQESPLWKSVSAAQSVYHDILGFGLVMPKLKGLATSQRNAIIKGTTIGH